MSEIHERKCAVLDLHEDAQGVFIYGYRDDRVRELFQLEPTHFQMIEPHLNAIFAILNDVHENVCAHVDAVDELENVL